MNQEDWGVWVITPKDTILNAVIPNVEIKKRITSLQSKIPKITKPKDQNLENRILEKIIFKTVFKRHVFSQVQWLTPVSPVLWETKVGATLGVRSLRPPWTTK